MKKQIVYMFLMLFCLSTHSKDCKVSKPSPDSISEYLRRITDSLVELKSPYQNLEELNLKKTKDFTEIMVVLKEIKVSYLCAAGLIEGYRKSKNKNISESSDLLAQGYQDFAIEIDQLLLDLKAELNGNVSSLGDQADKESNRIIAAKRNWDKVRAAIDIGRSAFTEITDPESKKVRRFFITNNEHELIIKELKSHFTLPMKKKEPSGIEAIASYYFESLMLAKYP